MPLKASVQRGAGQMRDRRLQAIKAVVELQQRMTPGPTIIASSCDVSTVE